MKPDGSINWTKPMNSLIENLLILDESKSSLLITTMDSKEFIYNTVNDTLISLNYDGKIRQYAMDDERLYFISGGFHGNQFFIHNIVSNSIDRISYSPYSNIVITEDNKIVIGSDNGNIYFYDNYGNEVSTFSLPNSPKIKFIIACRNNLLLIGAGDKNLYIVNSRGKIVNTYFLNEIPTSAVLLNNGSIFVKAGTYIFRVNSQLNGLANSPWPKIYGNNQNTNRLYHNSKNVSVIEDFDYINEFSLNNLYPNPFNPTINIEFELPPQSDISLKMYNVLGKLVDEINETNKGAGIYTYQWNASHLPSGIYFIKMESGNISQIRKCTLLK